VVREMCSASPGLGVKSAKNTINHSSRPLGDGSAPPTLPAADKNEEEKNKKTKRTVKKHATSEDHECQQRKCRRMFRSLHQHHIISQILSNSRSCRLWTNLLDIHPQEKTDVT
ncbi:ABC transporter G family member 21, partial [Clarias magur]